MPSCSWAACCPFLSVCLSFLGHQPGFWLRSLFRVFQRSCLLKDDSFLLNILCLSCLARECLCWEKPSSFSLCLVPCFRRKPEKSSPCCVCDRALHSLSEWVDNPYPPLGPRIKRATIIIITVLGIWGPQSSWTWSKARRFILPWLVSHLQNGATSLIIDTKPL